MQATDFSVLGWITTTTATALWTLSGTTQVSRYQRKHSPTHTYHGHQSSLICVLHLLQSTVSSLFNLRAWESFSTISLQVFFGLPLHTPYISSPNHCLLFTAHALTIATCFAAVLKVCHLIRVSLSTLYLELYRVVSHHTSHLCLLKCHLIFQLFTKQQQNSRNRLIKAWMVTVQCLVLKRACQYVWEY